MKVLRVGGCVRDTLLGLEPKDIDYVVVGARPSDMLSQGYSQVGKDFPVFLHPETGDEYALARTERSTGDGHHDFEMVYSPDVTIEEDLIRRDLTINAMAFDEDNEVIDPFGGREDLRKGVLRHVGDAFQEDPLRVFRVARFSARYAHLGFHVADETLELMSRMAKDGVLKTLSPERVWKELSRSLMEPTPGKFFETLRDADALDDWFAPIKSLIGVNQPAEHHPEGDVFTHTMMVLQQCERFNASLDVRFAALCHDFGKGLTPSDKWPHHHGHEASGVTVVNSFCKAMKVPSDAQKLASALTEFHTHVHMTHGREGTQMGAKAFDRLFTRLGVYRASDKHVKFLEEFLQGAEMDARGRTGYEDREYPNADIVRQVFEAAKNVTAKEFVDQGFEGKQIGEHMHRKRLIVMSYALKKIQGLKDFDYDAEVKVVHDRAGKMNAKGFDLLFKKLGAYKYPEALEEFLESAEMEELSSSDGGIEYPTPDTIREVFAAAKDVKAKEFIDEGFQGSEISEQIQRKKMMVMAEVLEGIRGPQKTAKENEIDVSL